MWNRLGFPRLLNRLGFKKRSGTSVVDVVYLLLLWVWLKVDSIAMFSRESLLSFSSAHKDALYDMLNREDLNWRKLQLHIARKLIATTEKNSLIRALVVDDSVKMRRGKKMPGVSCYFDHLTGRTVKGQQVLTLGLATQDRFVPLIREIFISASQATPLPAAFHDQRSALPPELPRIDVYLEPESCVCGQCHNEAKVINERITEELEIDITFRVKRYRPCKCISAYFGTWQHPKGNRTENSGQLAQKRHINPTERYNTGRYDPKAGDDGSFHPGMTTESVIMPKRLKRSTDINVLVWFCILLVASVWARADLPDFTGLIDAAKPAVVNITATSQAMAGEDPQAMFRQFFGTPFGAPVQPQTPQVSESMGSGFIISADGYILTNNHVVHGASKIMVKLWDRRVLEAKVIGTDSRADIALLKIRAQNLPVAKLGDPAHLKVGEWVLAIGAPFGFDYSVTQGIVSAKGRSLPNEAYVPFIQTDVPINPGNSGGPLINMQGQVVGINSQIYSRSGGYMGLSFAIPIDVAMNVVDQLKHHGKVERGYLGVEIQEVTKDLADVYGLNKAAGALVASIMPDTPAAKAGLKVGDVITAYDGQEIGLSSELPQQVGRALVGSKHHLTVVRAGKQMDIPFVVGALPAEGDDQANGGPQTNQGDIHHLGLYIRDLSAQEQQTLNVHGGVAVTQVYNGPAALAGIRSGDVILRLNNQDVKDVQSYLAIVRTLPVGKPIGMLINRQGNQAIVAITLQP